MEDIKREAKEILKVAVTEAEKLIEKARVEAEKMLRASGSSNTGFSLISKDISYIQKDISDIKEKLENKYVTKEEFIWVRNIVFGLMGILGIAALNAVFKTIFK